MTKQKNTPAHDEHVKVPVHARITKKSVKIIASQAKAEHRKFANKLSHILETYAEDTGAVAAKV